ncbi:MAG: prepilin-type N-terminal cleavage/methylation domain-containing protein [Kyrpidia sp.]|nr:prepilin-type N-terminal cleavage/methylation domain-containing protein [Kyrpidia sp.]
MTARQRISKRGPGDNRQKGLTLVEVLAALTILSLIVAGLLALFGQATATSQTDTDRLTAVHLAQSELAKWLAQPGHDYATLRARVDAGSGTVTETATVSGQWTRKVTVSRLTGFANPPLQVSLTVAGPRGVSDTLYTLITP